MTWMLNTYSFKRNQINKSSSLTSYYWGFKYLQLPGQTEIFGDLELLSIYLQPRKGIPKG